MKPDPSRNPPTACREPVETEPPRPKRGGWVVAAAVYAAWMVFLLVLGLMQRPPIPAGRDQGQRPSPQIAPPVLPKGS